MDSSFITLNIRWAAINWYVIGYALFSLCVIVYGTTYLNSSGSVRSVMYAIGSTLVMIFFGYRWFANSTPQLKNWPPVINMCPDYLTFVPNIPGSTSLSGGGCVDLLGVTTSSAGIQKILPSAVASINKSDNNLFKYTTNDVKAATTTAQLQIICTACSLAGVTWEGVYDGDTCIPINTLADKNAATAKCVSST
jgi:hypothetical protein